MEKILLEKSGMLVKASDRIDKRRWEDFAKRSSQDSIFQTVEFASVIKGMSMMTPVFLTVEDMSEEILAGLLIFINKNKSAFFEKFPYQIYTYEIPMFLKVSKGSASLDPLLEGLDKFAGEIWVPKIEITPRYHQNSINPNDSVQKLFNQHGYTREAVSTIIVDLSKSIDELWKSLGKQKRRSIRVAKRNGLETKTEGMIETKDYYELHRDTYYRLGLQAEPYSFFESIWKHLISTCRAKVISVYYENRLIAAQIVLVDNIRRELYSWRSASDSRSWRFQPNDLLHWTTIEWGKELGYKIYDLNHYYSDIPSSKFYGLYHFKKHFGASIRIDAYSKMCSQARLSAWILLHPFYKFITKIVADKQKNLLDRSQDSK